MRLSFALCSTLAIVPMLAAACSSESSSSTVNGGAGDIGGNSEAGGNTSTPTSTATSASTGGGQTSGGATTSGTPAQGGAATTGGANASETGGAGTGGRSSSQTSATGGRNATGGQSTGPTGTGGSATGGAGTTLSSSGGTKATGGSKATGGVTSVSSTTTGGTNAGGTNAGGTTGTSTSTAGDAVKSAGCGKTPTLKGGKDPITIETSRKYFLRIPDGYDNSHPYRLVVTYAESGSSAQSVMDRNYFRFAGFDAKNTVFVAPDAVGSAGSWSKTDVDFTDKILEQVEGDLCIDKSRVFASGFSFGGGMAIAIACTRADVFRGVAFWSGADLTGSCPDKPTKPIAYWASQASGDSSGTPMPSSGKIKQSQFAEVNGCTAEPNALNFPAAGQPHTCTIYKNCSAGHPTIYCVFNGSHGWEPVDPGQTTSWAPKEAWAFITQF
ncbi:MAG TPA: hypothetical protein VIV60_02940 [Polyangiaceae bacterium]